MRQQGRLEMHPLAHLIPKYWKSLVLPLGVFFTKFLRVKPLIFVLHFVLLKAFSTYICIIPNLTTVCKLNPRRISHFAEEKDWDVERSVDLLELIMLFGP